jgi:oxygen-independent coproporphyrinogen-3 oxidase
MMPPPLALYVHMPWCVRKCPYCDFNSHARPEDWPEARYVDALLADLDADLALVAGRRIESVFMGGGTPSLFSPESIHRLLAGIDTRIPLARGAEVTLEANPGTVERGRFAGYAAAGINRVSLGAQSFDDRMLQALGRIHGSGDIASAVAELRAAGIDNFNLDLMYALPGQSPDGALADLRSAIALRPTHLSHYQLTLEPGTAFYHRPPPLPDDDTAWHMQVGGQAELAAAGYAQYEVSAYAQPGRQCIHNLGYWQFGDYLGIGAGAHGKLTVAGSVLRTERPRLPREYMQQVFAGQQAARRAVTPGDLVFEFMLNALRLTAGFALDDFEARTGLPRTAVEEGLGRLAGRGLMRLEGDRWRASALGFRFLSDLQASFLPPATDAAA